MGRAGGVRACPFSMSGDAGRCSYSHYRCWIGARWRILDVPCGDELGLGGRSPITASSFSYGDMTAIIMEGGADTVSLSRALERCRREGRDANRF